ncbi:MAG: type II toxin-antitoxin system VapC family toxin [Hyphomicrobiales bacterium]|nr:type II toxin-antitoxin system VapC family toxin [Hyphomicrobiales bacterium]
MRYIDTSVIVSSLLREAYTDRAQQWLSEQASQDLAISDWVVSEFSSALSLKLRTEQMSREKRAEALAAFVRFAGNFLIVLPVSTSHFKAAARFADRYELGLRAGDALHLAVAAETGASLYTLDKRLAAAGPVVGVEAHLL